MAGGGQAILGPGIAAARRSPYPPSNVRPHRADRAVRLSLDPRQRGDHRADRARARGARNRRARLGSLGTRRRGDRGRGRSVRAVARSRLPCVERGAARSTAGAPHGASARRHAHRNRRQSRPLRPRARGRRPAGARGGGPRPGLRRFDRRGGGGRGRAAVGGRVRGGAARVVVFDDSIGVRVASVLPDVRPRIVRVPQAADLTAEASFDLAAAWPALPASRVLFALPAGIRPVKQPRLPLEPFDALAARHPQIRLLYVGPILDAEEGERLTAALSARPWARYIGAVPHAQMASLLRQTDVVMNCSLSEGGMANSVLEALACGRAVLAADIEGNRSVIQHDVSGLLFRDAGALCVMAERLTIDVALRTRLGAAGRAFVSERFPPAREIEGYLAVYSELTPVVTP